MFYTPCTPLLEPWTSLNFCLLFANKRCVLKGCACLLELTLQPRCHIRLLFVCGDLFFLKLERVVGDECCIGLRAPSFPDQRLPLVQKQASTDEPAQTQVAEPFLTSI